jgi:hypothetical protein
MTELTDSFKPVDPEVYALASQALPKIERRIKSGNVRAKGRRLRDVYQWLAAIEAGTWPGPCKVCGVVPLNEAGQQEADALARREAAAILGEVERETA